ncbi:MAG TPA: PAS domain-containing sensor histidine kinase [Sphingobacteriaceae bacterium]
MGEKGMKQEYAINEPGRGTWDLSGLLDNINVGFFSRDTLNNRYTNISRGCQHIYGYNTDDFRQNPSLYFEVVHPADRDILERQSRDLEQGKKSIAEYRILHKDGSVRWVELRAIPVIRDGKLIQVDGAINDITERKVSEIKLSNANAFFENMINALPGVFYVFDSHGRYKYWNKELETLTGYTADEIGGLHPLDLFKGEEKALIMRSIQQVIDKGQASVEGHLIRKGNKTPIPFYFSGRRIFIDDEPHIVGMGIDITEKREVENAIQKSQQMLSHILNSIPQAIFWKDTNCIYMGCNSVFARRAGLNNPDEIIGRTDFGLPWLQEESEKYRADDQEVMKRAVAKFHLIETQQQANGNQIWSDTTKIPLKTSDDEVYGLLGIYDDITQRILEEERLQKTNEDLIRKNIGLRQFSYIVSHNLRSPISKLLGLASLLQDDAADPALTKELISYIKSEVSDLDTVVRDLNTIVGAQDPGSMPLEEICIEEELKLVVRSLDTDIFQCDASVQADLNEAPVVKTVRAYFYSILFNLISNAIKYRHPQRRPAISVNSRKEHGFICISVADNGLGIDLSKHRNKVFGLYNRFHRGSIPGKGIGLNLVKTQVETLGGRIELDSTPEEGSRFTVFLPAS